MSGPVKDSDAQTWDKPCVECGSYFVSSTECNQDNPEALQHEIFYCSQCGESR